MTIQDGVYGHVSGTVGKTFTHSRGSAFELEVQGKGQYPDRWTVWADMPVASGDRLAVKGHLTARLGSYEKDGEKRHKVERSVNGAELVTHEPADTWSANVTDETPF